MKIKKILFSILMIMIFLINLNQEILAATVTPIVSDNLKASSNQATLISLKSDMIHDENISQITQSFIRKADVLVDNQDKLPFLPEKTMNKENFDAISMETWHPTYMGNSAACYIDLGATYQIEAIGYKDTYGNPTVVFSSGTPFHWKEIMTKQMNSFNTWELEENLNLQTRYLQLKIPNGTDAGISEIALYGYQIGEKEEKPTPDLTNPDFGITMDQAVGVNGFIDDPLEVLSVAGTVREYHNFSWVLDQNLKQNKFNPSYGGKWDFDNYYKTLFEAGITAMPCIQGTSKAIANLPDMTRNEIPVPIGADPNDPQSYATHASTMFQYAARYGSQKVEDSKLLLASDQEKKSGLGYLTYYENSNEPDKTWEGEKSYFSPYQLAAMCSSDYDGHEGKLGDTYGVKQADPNAKLVMGGLCNGEGTPQYLDLMKLWFENNREDKKLAFDVINFHTYSGEKSPEESQFKSTCQGVTNWRNENARDKEVWLTEFGWDSNQNSPNKAPNNETQRDWLVRGYLIAEAAGIDRTTMYMVRDASWEGNPGKYATCGLTTEKGAWKKKPSWYGTYTLKDTLKGYTFNRVIEENDQIYTYEFINKETNQLCYAIWSSTSNGSKIKNYQFQVGNQTRPTLTKLADGYIDGEKTRLKIKDGAVTFDVTESPVFLTLDGVSGSYEAPTNTRIQIDGNSIQEIEASNLEGKKEEEIQKVQESVKNNFKLLIDEQQSTPIAPKMNFKGNFSTSWENANLGKNYPLTAILDLGEEYQISNIGIFDTYSVGNIKFYAGTKDQFEEKPFAEYGLNSYMYWKVVDTDCKTRYVKIVKENTAQLSEIAFYGYSNTQNEEDPNQELNHSVIVDKTKLGNLIEQIEKEQESDYTKDSWEKMKAVLLEAKKVWEQESTQGQVDQMYEKLSQAIQNLEKQKDPDPKPEEPTPDPMPDPDPKPEEPIPDPTPEEPTPDPIPNPDPTPEVPNQPEDKNQNDTGKEQGNNKKEQTVYQAITSNVKTTPINTTKTGILPKAGDSNNIGIIATGIGIMGILTMCTVSLIKRRKK